MKTINTKNKKRYKVGFKIVLLTGALYMFLTYYTHNKHHKTKVNNLQEVTTDELKPLF